MTKKTEGHIWLRSQIRFAAAVSFVFSIMIFIGIILLHPGELGWNSLPVFLIGSFIGVAVVLRRPLNPFNLNPKSAADSHKLNYDEVSALLEKHWALIPKSFFWLAAIFYPLLVVLYNFITISVYTFPTFSLVGLLGGFATSVTFCGSVSFMLVYRNWN